MVLSGCSLCLSMACSNLGDPIRADLETPAAAVPVEAEERADLVEWRSVAAGEAEARAGERLVFYFFTADWCAPCDVLKNDVFSESAIAELIHEGYVPIEVLDRTREDGVNTTDVDRVLIRFLVSAFPTLVIARPDRGYAVTEAGLLTTQGMADFLRDGPGELFRLEREAAARRAQNDAPKAPQARR